MHIKLTALISGRPFYMPVDWGFGSAGEGECSWVSSSNDNINDDGIRVREPPAEIAAKIEAARREERIRERAYKIADDYRNMVQGRVEDCNDSGMFKALPKDFFILHGVIIAEEEEAAMDKHFAAERARAVDGAGEGEKS